MREVWVVSPGGRSSTGGICRMVDYTATAWATTVWATASPEDATPMRVVDSGGMRRGPAMVGGFARALLEVARGCAFGRVALLHVHVAAYGSVARKAPFVLLGRALRVPVALHLHGADFEEFHARLGVVGRWLVGTVFRRASAIVVLGARARTHTIARVGVDPRRVYVLANAVPDAPYRPRLGAPRGRLLFLGALTERKGLPELLEALAGPDMAVLDWSLELVGNGEKAAWQAMADRLGVGERVRFLGWMPSEQARRELAEADILVLPSRQEALPMVILEAMAAARPVVAADVGEIGEAVIDGETGLLVPPEDSRALGVALARLIASPELCSRLGRAGRARFEALFDIGGYSARLAAIFARAASEVPRGLTPLSTRARTETP